ncbi:MAG TPA: pyruvate:ferredoxin (flavodoxin) oxidoreductase [Planctomycetota bacterium]|nr:pyruvate:ferredoxin (flavodoxin) oxidoreductase [Planctomycetota bacterium]
MRTNEGNLAPAGSGGTGTEVRRPVQALTVDANEAVASVAHRTNEVIAIYPITPASAMGELADEWSAQGRRNLWGRIPEVVEMQSEAGAIGAVHGALQAGALATTFTASQGLLLMVPSLYKIAGELTPFALHVAARTVASHALSIFGDHSDVMACRQTGFALLCSGSVQEAQDFALVAQASTLASRVPFLHFFDGFRTSHEIAKIDALGDEDLRALVDEDHVRAHRSRALTPDRPVLRGTAQNPDTFFQAREACNPLYAACPRRVQEVLERLASRTGRRYGLFDYVGHPRAERILVVMGSGAETAHETALWLAARGEAVGVLKVRLFRPFSVADFARALPATVRAIAVLDRTKEPGAIGEPLYQDVVTALHETRGGSALPRVIGGRYGLSSKEFTPAMVKAVFDELSKDRPQPHFTVGIVDDLSGLSLGVDPEFDIEPEDVTRAVFYGLGSDGTVGANKNTIKIIGEETGRHAQAYFVYDSKKAGSMTISHLRFGPRPIRAPYLIRRAQFVACHHPAFLERLDVLESAAPGAVFLLNFPGKPEAVWDHLPREIQSEILDKRLRLWVIDAAAVAEQAGVGRWINTIMQTCFFALSGVLPREEAIHRIKESIRKTYEKKGPEILRRNCAAVDQALAHLHEVSLPGRVPSGAPRPPVVPDSAPDFVRRVTSVLMANRGNLLPVSAFPVDGTWPTGTTQWEKRNLAAQIPVWDPGVCIQCNKCVLACPHAAIRAKLYAPSCLGGAPPSFKSTEYRSREIPDRRYSLQVAPEDCTGCSLCVEFCPAKDKSNPRHKAIDMQDQPPLLEAERENYRFFLDLPEADRSAIKPDVKGSQFLQPLFEYSGACQGCGETPYLKLLTQLFGDRALVANATGCSSIYGANLPTTPWGVNREGRGPAWANSLFEDNGEFGLGFRLALDVHEGRARDLLGRLSGLAGETLVREILEARQGDEAGIAAQRRRVGLLREKLSASPDPLARELERLAEYLVAKSVWLVGGDGWAYDIGFGGLDHVLALGRKVNILVLDTQVYSNTGGQQSKATPLGAAAKFASSGKGTPKKDLGLIAMSYGNVYVAQVAFGARDAQTVKAFLEAESFPGPSLIIAYSHCIAHGYDLSQGPRQQRLAAESGMWPLFRFDPRRVAEGKPPLELDSPDPKIRALDYMRNETRFLMAEKVDPDRFKGLLQEAQAQASRRFAIYRQLAGITVPAGGGSPEGKT